MISPVAVVDSSCPISAETYKLGVRIRRRNAMVTKIDNLPRIALVKILSPDIATTPYT